VGKSGGAVDNFSLRLFPREVGYRHRHGHLDIDMAQQKDTMPVGAYSGLGLGLFALILQETVSADRVLTRAGQLMGFHAKDSTNKTHQPERAGEMDRHIEI